MPRLADVVDLLHAWYPPGTADAWDAVGLVAGDPDAEVGRVMLAVDHRVVRRLALGVLGFQQATGRSGAVSPRIGRVRAFSRP